MPVYYYETEIGRIGIAEKNGSITHLYFETDQVPPELSVFESPLLKEAARQLKDYLAGELKEFSLPIDYEGTAFMKEVWAALSEIPFGQTASYKELAVKIGNPKASRAVGLANNRNQIPIFIPCHRVIGANGALTGYRGGLEVKKRLLELEKKFSRQ